MWYVEMVLQKATQHCVRRSLREQKCWQP